MFVCFSVGGVRWLTPVGSAIIVPCISPQPSHLLVQITTLWDGYLIRDEDTSPFCDIYAALSGKHMEFWEFSKQSRMFSCLSPSGSHGCGPSGWCERSLNTTQSPKLWWPLSAKLLQRLNDGSSSSLATARSFVHPIIPPRSHLELKLHRFR